MSKTSPAPSQETRDYAAARSALMTRLDRTPPSHARARAAAALRYLDANERMSHAEKTERIGGLNRYLDRHA